MSNATYRLDKAVGQGMRMLKDLGIPYGNVEEVTINYRAKTRWGQCRRVVDHGKVTYKINISAELLKSDATKTGLLQTVIHELLHTCPDCMCHTGAWKRYAELVNRAYGHQGIKVTRCTSAAALGIDPSEREIPYKYAIICPRCGVIAKYQRMAAVIQRPDRYRCSRCKGDALRAVPYSLVNKVSRA